MADPLSAIANVAGVVLFGGQVLVKLTEYINDIHQAPKHVEELANELMATTAALQRFKLLVIDRQASNSDELKVWAADSQTMLQNCEETFKQINEAVEKAQIKSKGIVKGEVISRVKWVWNKKETNLLKVRLSGYEAVIRLMLQTLSSKQIDNIDQTTQKLHELVKSIQNERANIKERLLVMDKDHPRFSNPDGVVSFQEPVPEETEAPVESSLQPPERLQQGENSLEDDRDGNDVDVWSSFNKDIITKSSWNSGHIEAIKLSRAPDPIDMSYQPNSIKVVVASGISPMLEIDLNESAITRISEFLQACSNHTVTYTYESVSVRRETVTIPTTTTSVSSRRDPTRPVEWRATDGFVKAYKEQPFWQKLARSPLILPALVGTPTIDALLDARKQTVTQEIRMEETTREVDVPYTVQHSGTRKSPLVRPPHMLNFESGKIWYPISFAEIKRSSFTSLILSPNPRAPSCRRDEGSLEIQCKHKTIADEIEKNLSKLIGFTRFAWLGHCEAFCPMAPERYECTGPSERDKLAMDEEFKWVAFASAFAKVSESSN